MTVQTVKCVVDVPDQLRYAQRSPELDWVKEGFDRLVARRLPRASGGVVALELEPVATIPLSTAQQLRLEIGMEIEVRIGENGRVELVPQPINALPFSKLQHTVFPTARVRLWDLVSEDAITSRDIVAEPNPQAWVTTARAIDIVCPIGLGQRGQVISPPKAGKTTILSCWGLGMTLSRMFDKVIVILFRERPEEVTELCGNFAWSSIVEVWKSTFDEPNLLRSFAVLELAFAHAKQLVRMDKNVAILWDSMTRSARGYNQLVGGLPEDQQGAIDKGGLFTGTLDHPTKGEVPSACDRVKALFGSARAIPGGGSLTVIGTTLTATGSLLDERIKEEFTGTGNMDLVLSRELQEAGIYPAINIPASGTRRASRLRQPQEEADAVWVLKPYRRGKLTTAHLAWLLRDVKSSTWEDFLNVVRADRKKHEERRRDSAESRKRVQETGPGPTIALMGQDVAAEIAGAEDPLAAAMETAGVTSEYPAGQQVVRRMRGGRGGGRRGK